MYNVKGGYMMPIRECLNVPSGRNKSVSLHQTIKNSYAQGKEHKDQSSQSGKSKMNAICNKLSSRRKNNISTSTNHTRHLRAQNMSKKVACNKKKDPFVVKNSFPKPLRKVCGADNQTSGLESFRMVLLSNNPSDLKEDEKPKAARNHTKHKRSVSYNHNVQNQDLKGLSKTSEDYSTKANESIKRYREVSQDRKYKKEAEIQHPRQSFNDGLAYYPMDQLLQELCFNDTKHGWGHTNYKINDSVSKLRKMVPKHLNLAKHQDN